MSTGLEQGEPLGLRWPCPPKATAVSAKTQAGVERKSAFPTQTIQCLNLLLARKTPVPVV